MFFKSTGRISKRHRLLGANIFFLRRTQIIILKDNYMAKGKGNNILIKDNPTKTTKHFWLFHSIKDLSNIVPSPSLATPT